MTTTLLDSSARTNSHRRAFTLVELLVIIAVIAVLCLLRVSALCNTTGRTRAVQCAANLKQFTLALHIYGSEYGEKLPQSSSGFWPWDLTTSAANSFLRFGATRNNMYCPANPAQNADGLWNFTPSFRVIGYAVTLPGMSTLVASNLNPSLTPVSIPGTGGTTPPPPPGRRVLLADATISNAGQDNPALRDSYQYTAIVGGYSAPGWPGHRTSHLNGRLPAGGNLGMLDGHVEWRPFNDMLPRTVSGIGAPVFWW